jgi:hypothetical protein
MPAQRSRGGARGGGIAREGRHDGAAQGGGEEQEKGDQLMRDKEHAEKRKREGPQGGAEGSPPRRDSRFTNDSDSASAEATPRKKVSPTATRRLTRRAEKEGRDNGQHSESSPTPSSNRSSEAPREVTMHDIMQQLLEAQRMARERDRREQERERKEREKERKEQEERRIIQEKEDRYREEIRQLQSTVTTLVLDIKSLQEAAPNWGSLQSSSLATVTTDSYASVTARGVQLPNQDTNIAPSQGTDITPTRSSRSSVSFDLSDQSSPPRSPPISVGTSIRSAMKKAKSPLEIDMVIDIKNLDTEGHTGTNLMTRTKNRILAAIRSNDGLDNVVLNRFMIRHTNEDVHLAYFRIDKEAEKVARAYADEWLPMFLKGARLIETAWYPVKVDYIPKREATDQQTGAISQETREAFAEENEVEVKLMRWLGRPKEHTQYASALVKLATKEQVEKLLQKQARGEDVELFGCMVQVSPFHDNRGPRACFRCHRFGHTQKECRNTTTCLWCAQEGHENCKIGEPKCCNCGEKHPASYRKCPEYRRQQEREINLRRHD